MATNTITPEQARAELARRRGAASGPALAPTLATPTASSITRQQARDELARRRQAAMEGNPAVEAASASASKVGRDFWGDNSGPPTGAFGGEALNATAGANQGIYSVVGLPVDAMTGAMNAAIRGANYVTGSELPTIDNPVGGSRSIAQAAGALHPVLDPENTKAATQTERIVRAAGEGAASSVAGAGVVGALARTGTLAARPAGLAAGMFGRVSSAGTVAREAAVSAAAGAGASAAAEAAPEAWKPSAALAGGLASGGIAATATGIPGAVRGAARAAGDAVAPLTAGGRERLAADRLRRGATDPEALRRSLAEGGGEIVEGSMPTTSQLSGDLGILAMERGASTRRPDAFAARRADQNAARLDALGTIQPDGAPEAVTASLRQSLDAIDRSTQSAMNAALTNARLSTDALGVGLVPEAAGDALRGAYENARAAAKVEERRLWSAVDPDGSLTAPVVGVRRTAKEILQNRPRFSQFSDAEAGIYQAVSDMEDVLPFSEVTELRSVLGDALRQERRTNGESQTYRRLSMVRSALEGDLDGAITSKVAQENEAVAAGTMRIEDTMLAKIEREQEGFLAGRQATARSANGGSSAVSYGAAGSIAVSGSPGASGQAGRRLGAAARYSGLEGSQPVAPNFDAAAQERLTAASAATRNRANTFDNGTLAPIRRRPSTAAPYDVSPSAVAGRLFFPGAKSADAIATYRQAVGDGEALRVMQDYAVDRLRKAALRPDGTFDPAKLQTWRRSHADALRAFPDLDARFADAAKASQTMEAVAAGRKRALDEAQAGALGRIMAVETPGEVSNIVGGLLSRQDAASQMTRLRKAIGDDRQAAQGLRKAVAEYMTARLIGNTEVGTSGREGIKSDAFQTFVSRNTDALRAAGFSDAELKVIRDIAADLQRTNRSVAAVRNPGGSNTAQDTLAAGGDAGVTILRRLIYGLGASAGGAIYTGSITGLAAGILPEIVGSIRQAGLRSVDDILTDAILNPSRARALLTQPGRKTEAATVKMLGQLYRRALMASSIETTKETTR